MAKYQIGEIRKKIAEFRNDTTWLLTKARWDGDYDLYNLKPYSAGKGYFSYTSNSPRVYADKLISMLVDSKLNIRLPLDILTEPDRSIANNIERFFYGCFQLNDERLSFLPNMSSIRQQRAFLSVIFGGFGRLAYVYKNENGETVPLIETWDLYNTAYCKGGSGLSWAAYTRTASREEIDEEWKVPKLPAGQKEFELTDYWNDEVNFVIVGDDFWAKKPTPHGLKKNPVTIHRVGAQIPLTGRINRSINADVGESAFKANRQLEPIFNKVMSDLITIVSRGVKTPIGEWRKDGKSQIDLDIWQTEKASTIPMLPGEDIKPILPVSMPADTQPLLQLVSGEKQRGSLPHTAYGELGFRLSGFAINQLQGNLSTVIAPFGLCMEQAYKMDCMQLLDQYAEEAWNPINIRGRTSRNQTFGYPKAEMLSPESLRKGWYPEVNLVPVLPKDDAQKMQLAQLARQPDAAGVPLLSDRTILDEIVEDPDLEKAKKNQQFGENLPINRLYEAYLTALDDMPNVPVEQNIKAQNILAALRQLMGGQVPGQTQPRQPTALENTSMQSPGTGIPSGETGMTSNVLPAESMGGFPGGAQNAAPPEAQGGA